MNHANLTRAFSEASDLVLPNSSCGASLGLPSVSTPHEATYY